MEKYIIITGANRGLGKSLASYFYKKNYNLVIIARDKKELLRTKKEVEKTKNTKNFFIYKCDISKKDQVDRFVSFLKTSHILPNVLINNASVFGPIDLFLETDFKEWEKTFGTNFFGTAYLTKQIIMIMKKNHKQRSKIINIVGGGASKPYSFLSSYATSKAALIRFSEQLSEELKKMKIDINCLAPGPLNTRFTDIVLKEGKKKLGNKFYNQILNIKKSNNNYLEFNANMCEFLISNKSNNLTGKYFSARFDDINKIYKNKKSISLSDLYTMRRLDNYSIKNK